MEKGIKRFDNVFYPVGGIANICDDISDLFCARVIGKSTVNISRRSDTVCCRSSGNGSADYAPL